MPTALTGNLGFPDGNVLVQYFSRYGRDLVPYQDFCRTSPKKEERIMGGLFGVVARDDCLKEIEGREDTNMTEYLIFGSQTFSQTTLPVCGL